MNTVEQTWCEEKIAASDSDWRLAALFAPPPQRPVLQALLAFRLELADIVERGTDHALSHARLNWWREEIIRVAQGGAPQHPLTRLLYAAGLEVAPLNKQVRAAEIELAGGPLDNEEEFRGYAEADQGTMVLLAARAAGRGAGEALRDARALGAALTRTRLLTSLGHEARRGRVLLPRTGLQAAGIEADMLTADRAAPALLAYLRQESATALRELRNWQAAHGHGQIANSVVTALAGRRLELLARPARDPLAHSVQPGPFAKLFTAWKAARRSIRDGKPQGKHET